MADIDQAAIDTLAERIRRYPLAYFSYILDNVRYANECRYEMQSLFVYQKGDIEKFFRNLTEFLSSAANVSRVFWCEGGISGREKKLARVRASILRELIGLDDQHPLSKREWRNHLAHYESRIDDWMVRSANMNVARRNIGPVGRTIVGLDDHEIFEQYDPNTDTFYFRGAKYDLRQIQNDINEICGLIIAKGYDR